MKLYQVKEMYDGENRLFNQGILVQDNTIVAVGGLDDEAIRSAEVDETVDLSNQFVMPGLIDCHVHIGNLHTAPASAIEWTDATVVALQNLSQLLSSGVVACRDLGSCQGMTIGITAAQKRGLLPRLPLLISSGRALTATGGHGYSIGIECDGPDAFTRGCRAVIKEGADVVKVMMSGGVNSPGQEPGPPEVEQAEIDAAVQAAHARGRKVAVHAHGNTAIRRSVLAGVDSIEHGVFNSADILDMMLERGTFLVPTLSAPYYASVEGLRQQPDNPDHAKSNEVVHGHNAITLQAFKQGIPIAMGTDAGSPFNPYNAAYYELILLHGIGLQVSDVLRIATHNGALLLGLPHLGDIAPGKQASFIAMPISPFDDINAICGPKSVWLSGQQVV